MVSGGCDKKMTRGWDDQIVSISGFAEFGAEFGDWVTLTKGPQE